MFVIVGSKGIPVGINRGQCWSDRFASSASADGCDDRRMVRRELENSLNLNISRRYAPADEEVQQVRQLVRIRRPIGRTASAEEMAIVIRDGGEENSPFWCNKSCSPSSMLRIPVPAY